MATSPVSSIPAPSAAEDTEVYSRITGYYRPVKNWNDGKSQEFADRVGCTTWAIRTW